MTTLVFPLHVERFDDMQGMYGRQVARLISEQLTAANLRSTRLTWYAKSGEQRAHVAVEAPFPINVILEEAQAHQAQHVILGRLRVAPESTRLELAILDVEDSEHTPIEVFDETTAIHALPETVERASHAVLQRLLPGGFSGSAAHASDAKHRRISDKGVNPSEAFEAWRASLQQADARELEQDTAK